LPSDRIGERLSPIVRNTGSWELSRPFVERKWSIRSISLAAIMIAMGALLVGGGHFVDAQ